MRSEVSVVIPTHNRPQLLVRAVRSALAQSHPVHEVVVVLDGEDGVTGAALSSVSDMRLRLVTNRTALGGAEARNVGVRAATGRFVALLDDDDEWLPTKLARQVSMAEQADDTPFVVTTQYLYRAEGHADEIWPGHLPGCDEPLSEFLFSSRGGFQTSTYLCLRSLLLQVPFRAGLKKHQDWDWFLRLTSLPGFQVLVVPQALSVYHVPLRMRSSTSGKLDWRFSQRWARSQLGNMTPKAYAMFLVRICARSAAIEGNSLSPCMFLVRELLLVAAPTPRLWVEFAIAFLMPERIRLGLRYSLLKLRGAFTTSSSDLAQELA